LYEQEIAQQTCNIGSACVGLARTIYIRCTYGIFGREITKYTVIYGVYIRSWPTLRMCMCTNKGSYACPLETGLHSGCKLKFTHVFLGSVATFHSHMFSWLCGYLPLTHVFLALWQPSTHKRTPMHIYAALHTRTAHTNTRHAGCKYMHICTQKQHTHHTACMQVVITCTYAHKNSIHEHTACRL